MTNNPKYYVVADHVDYDPLELVYAVYDETARGDYRFGYHNDEDDLVYYTKETAKQLSNEEAKDLWAIIDHSLRNELPGNLWVRNWRIIEA